MSAAHGSPINRTLHVVVLHDDETTTVQVTNSHPDAVAWASSVAIPASDWEAFYDALGDDRPDGMTRDRSGMSPEQILHAYVGDPGIDGEHHTWGDDFYVIEVYPVTVWSPIVGR